eukprot:TRINITY_DN6314_c0_g1_i1.p1 TRINITY_DN6314_c0_g1~~TRINITY_DN6314_c0_g1_i1.p1  ORF type:complete len:116 (-),score=35.78 TRINITY_DN6314_c0_g1_i1:6-353(-)
MCIRDRLDTSACVAEAKFANRRRLETLLGKPLIRGQYLPDEEDDDDIGLDDEALMEINMQRARDRRAKASAAAPVSTIGTRSRDCLLYTSDAADDLLCVDLGGRRIIQNKIDDQH